VVGMETEGLFGLFASVGGFFKGGEGAEIYHLLVYFYLRYEFIDFAVFSHTGYPSSVVTG